MSDSGGVPVRQLFGMSATTVGEETAFDALDSPLYDVVNPASGIETTNRAGAAPHTSQLYINVKPGDDNRLLVLEAFGIGEELLHGNRKQFGLTRSVHLLKQRSRRQLYEYLQGECEAAAVAETLARCDLAAETITSVQERFLETIDQYLANRVMNEPGYFDDYVAGITDQHSVDAEFLRTELRTFRDELEQNRIATRDKYDEIYSVLEDIGATYTPTAAQAVADAALNVPYAIGPVDTEAVASRPHTDLDLATVLDRRVEAAHEIVQETSADPTEQGHDPLATIAEQLREATEVAGVDGQVETTIDAIELPLLDAPTHVENPDASQAIQDAPTPLDRVINKAFRLPGNFGGIVYWNTNDEPGWLVNPLIGDMDYRRRWTWAYVGDRLLDFLFLAFWERVISDQSPEAYTEPPDCPLCRVSRTPQCGGDTCPFSHVVSTFGEQVGDLIDALRLIDSDLYDRLCDRHNARYGVISNE